MRDSLDSDWRWLHYEETDFLYLIPSFTVTPDTPVHGLDGTAKVTAGMHSEGSRTNSSTKLAALMDFRYQIYMDRLKPFH